MAKQLLPPDGSIAMLEFVRFPYRFMGWAHQK
jgi:hypothetical protein